MGGKTLRLNPIPNYVSVSTKTDTLENENSDSKEVMGCYRVSVAADPNTDLRQPQYQSLNPD